MAGTKQARAKNGTSQAKNGTSQPKNATGQAKTGTGQAARPARNANATRPRPSGQSQGQSRPSGQSQSQNQARPSSQSQSQSQTRRARDKARARELAEARATAEEVPAGPPRWVQYASLALAIVGLGVSIYMTYEHYTNNATLACKVNSVVNCGAVTTSPEAMVFGVFPVAVLGLAFYAFMVAATTPWAWRSQRREIALLRLASVVVGIGFVIYLLYVELYQVGFICLECTSVHVITFLLFVLVVLSAAIWGLPGARDRAGARAR